MSEKKQKLELTWIGKEKRPRLEPRVLVEDAAKSHHAVARRRDGKDIFDNMLIHGDNLLALKALEQRFSGKVKCIYIDPPYNTGNAFEHYDDCLEHSIWLGLMRERLELLKNLLADDGVILVQIDKNESAYLKVLMDEIFSREAYITTIAVRMSATSGFKIEHADKTIVKNAEYIHVYSRNLTLSPAYERAEYDAHYSCILKPEGNLYVIHSLTECHEVKSEMKRCGLSLSAKSLPLLFSVSESFRCFVYDNREFIGRTHTAPAEALALKDKIIAALPTEKHVVEFSTKTGAKYFIKKTATSLNQYIPISLKYRMVDTYEGYAEELSNILGDWWSDFFYDMGNVEDEGGVTFKASKKPERLIFRILNMFTNPGDLVLDSFLGSGTTAAVAHKMGRRWIGVELGDHCYTHCKVRLDKVIDGEDPGGITKAVGWKGGGGYRFYELAPTFITKDQWGQEVINRDYNPAMLAEAVCKLEGYVYSPSQDEYFIHGHATEKAFIYVTTNFMRKKNLAAISERLGEGRHLLICCKAFDKAAAGEFDNLTVRKIPDAVLNKCEWGHDDYSLNVANLPMAKEDEKIEQMELL